MKKLLLVLFFFAVVAGLSFAQQKYALVIGNGTYTNFGTLRNPVNDANDVAAALQGLGWTVDKVLNGNLTQMENAAVRLKSRLSDSGGNAYGFFFYAGHGVQMNGVNYLIPSDANIPDRNFLRERALSVQAMMGMFDDAKNALNIVVLDACRDFPATWAKNVDRGLAVISAPPSDSIIMYATGAGKTTSDGTGKNGLFTAHLLENMKTTNLDVREVFIRTMSAVTRASNNEQRPALYTDFTATAYLGQRSAPAPAVQPTPASAVQSAPASAVQPAPAPRVQPAPTPAVQPTPAPRVQPAPTPAVQPVTPPVQSLPNNPDFEIKGTVLIKYKGSALSVTIPAGVTAIWDSAFTGKNITSITIPNSVIFIGEEAFKDNKLTGVTIGNNVTTIGRNAFENNRLTSITIPNSVTSIGEYAFKDNNLTSVTIGDGVTTIGQSVFSGNRLTSVIIPNSVTSIGWSAFSVNLLTSVTIGSNVASIGNFAFYDNKLTSVTIPDSVTSIGVSAFDKCPNLTSIEVAPGNANYSSEDGVLFNKNKTLLIEFPGGKRGAYSIPSGVITIGNEAFRDTQLTGITIPNGVTTIKKHAFADTQLTSVTIPSSVTSIEDNAFYACKLTSVAIGANVTIGKDVFIVWNSGKFESIGFMEIYEKNGKKAGTYAYDARSKKWNKRS